MPASLRNQFTQIPPFIIQIFNMPGYLSELKGTSSLFFFTRPLESMIMIDLRGKVDKYVCVG